MKRFFDNLNSAIRNSEASIVNFLSMIAPWLAPLAPAYMTYKHMSTTLAFPGWVSLMMAIMVEILGLSTISTWLSFWAHNKRYSTEYKKAPVGMVVVSFVFYLAVILSVNVLLEANPSRTNIVICYALLGLLTLPAGLLLASRTQHTELLDEISEQKESRKRTKEETKTLQEKIIIPSETKMFPKAKDAISYYVNKYPEKSFSATNAAREALLLSEVAVNTENITRLSNSIRQEIARSKKNANNHKETARDYTSN